MLPRSLLLLLSYTIPIISFQVPFALDSSSRGLNFELRHLHVVTNTSRILFSDIHPKVSEHGISEQRDPYNVKTRVIKTHRPSSFASLECARVKGFGRARCPGNGRTNELSWTEEEIVSPNVTDRETLLQLAKMTNNAYSDKERENGREWYDLGKDWNTSFPFGWEDDADGFRGHVFATADNSTVVISIKGTSAGLFGGGPTTKKDKLNDNLLFSCCCARVGITWSTVCGCYAGGSKCDQNCVEASLADDSLFYPIGTNLYNNVSYMYPDSNIWLIGHSLGGALASLLGVTFGSPVVAFEAPGEKMAAGRLHLPSPPSTQHVTHVYHTADPIAMGTCNGVLSTCAIAGYAMESRCHLGQSIIYDTVTAWNWSVDVRTHPIRIIIEKLLSQDWPHPPGSPPGNNTMVKSVPEPKPEDDCVECYDWEFGHFLDSKNW